jgi:integrase
MLTGLRQGQILDLKRSDWDGTRLKVPGVKGGKTVIYEGPGLSAAVSGLLLPAKQGSRSMYLLSSRNGSRYTSDGFRSIWHRCMKKYVAAGGEAFAENDLPAKVASESSDLATASGRLGYQDQRTTHRVYRRKPSTVSVFRPDESVDNS